MVNNGRKKEKEKSLKNFLSILSIFVTFLKCLFAPGRKGTKF